MPLQQSYSQYLSGLMFPIFIIGRSQAEYCPHTLLPRVKEFRESRGWLTVKDHPLCIMHISTYLHTYSHRDTATGMPHIMPASHSIRCRSTACSHANSQVSLKWTFLRILCIIPCYRGVLIPFLRACLNASLMLRLWDSNRCLSSHTWTGGPNP